MRLSRRVSQTDAASGEGPKLLLIAALATALMAAFGARMWLPAGALVPVVATALFVLAGIAAAVSWLRWRRPGTRAGWLDLAGIFTCIGIVASMLGEPEQMAQFVESATRSK